MSKKRNALRQQALLALNQNSVEEIKHLLIRRQLFASNVYDVLEWLLAECNVLLTDLISEYETSHPKDEFKFETMIPEHTVDDLTMADFHYSPRSDYLWVRYYFPRYPYRRAQINPEEWIRLGCKLDGTWFVKCGKEETRYENPQAACDAIKNQWNEAVSLLLKKRDCTNELFQYLLVEWISIFKYPNVYVAVKRWAEDMDKAYPVEDAS